jgi:hypothetical protein
MIGLLCFALAVLASPFKSKLRLEAENAVLRHQLNVVRRRLPGRVRLTNHDRWFFIQLYRWFPSILRVLTIIRPETLVRWHRTGFRCYWRWKSPPNSANRKRQITRHPWRTSPPPLRPCLSFRYTQDHIIVSGEMHLRRVLKSYADYYNRVRTHRSLNKDAPASRPVQRTGVISSRTILGGLHHHYARV